MSSSGFRDGRRSVGRWFPRTLSLISLDLVVVANLPIMCNYICELFYVLYLYNKFEFPRPYGVESFLPRCLVISPNRFKVEICFSPSLWGFE